MHTGDRRYSDSLRTGRSGDRNPVWARFSIPAQTGPEAHPTYCTMGRGSFPGPKWPECDANHPLSSRAEVESVLELYLRLPSVTA